MYRQGVLLTTFMLTSLAAVICGAVQRFAPSWHPLPIIIALVLIVFECGVIHFAYRRDRMWTNELARYIAPELLLMVVLMRIATSLSFGQNQIIEQARSWLFDPLSVLDLPFLIATGIAFIFGILAHSIAEALRTLEPQEFEQAVNTKDSIRIAQILAQERGDALRTISGRFITGGVLILLSLGVEAVNVREVLAESPGISIGSAIGALVYLISGFLLYSQGRLALLRTRWQLDGANVQPQVLRRWNQSSWVLVAGVALLAVFLPRTYGLSLLDTLRAIMGGAGYLLLLLGYAVVWIFSMLALIPAMLLALLSGQGAPTGPIPFDPPALPEPVQEAVRQPQIGPAIIFWVCMILLVIYAIVTILQRHPVLFDQLFKRGPLKWLWAWLRELWSDTRGWAVQAAKTVRERLRQVRPTIRRPSFIRLGALAPRDLVRYFYRSTLRRAATGGVDRRPGQTPYEFSRTLSRALPEAETDISALTESYLAAQYSRKEVAREEAQQVRQPWQRLRDQLRSISRKSEITESEESDTAD